MGTARLPAPAARAGRPTEREGRSSDAIAHLENAVALYRGDLFEDDPYADWCGLERMELQNRFLGMLMRQAELSLACGEAETGVACLRRGLLTDPFREDLHQALIQMLADLGRRKEALEQYRECERILREELGTDPLPATRRLERLLRA